MKLYFNLNEQSRCDETGLKTVSAPVLYYKHRVLVEITMLEKNGSEYSAADLSDIASWRAALKVDLSSSTPVLSRTPDSVLGLEVDFSGAASGLLKIPVNCATNEFKTATDGKSNLPAIFEIWGNDAGGLPAFYARFNVACSAVADPEGLDYPVATGWTATASDLAVGKTAFGSGGAITGTLAPGIDTSDANAIAADLLTGKTAYVAGEKLTGTLDVLDTSDATASASDILAGETAYVAGVKITGTLDMLDTSDADAIAADLRVGKTAYVAGEKLTGTIANQDAVTITPGTTAQTIAAGKYLAGAVTVSGDANLVSENVKSGVTIFGISGTHAGGTSFYKCASVDTSSHTWTGYLASSDSQNGYSFADVASSGLVYDPDEVIPVVGTIYSADARVKVKSLWAYSSYLNNENTKFLVFPAKSGGQIVDIAEGNEVATPFTNNSVTVDTYNKMVFNGSSSWLCISSSFVPSCLTADVTLDFVLTLDASGFTKLSALCGKNGSPSFYPMISSGTRIALAPAGPDINCEFVAGTETQITLELNRTSGQTSVYQDGILKQTVSWNPSISDDFGIGWFTDGDFDRFFVGTMKAFRIQAGAIRGGTSFEPDLLNA